jgi:hypothetical protein
MSIRKLTLEQEAAKQLEKKTISQYLKEGMTLEQAIAARDANRANIQQQLNG